jgi:hypothetical protein
MAVGADKVALQDLFSHPGFSGSVTPHFTQSSNLDFTRTVIEIHRLRWADIATVEAPRFLLGINPSATSGTTILAGFFVSRLPFGGRVVDPLLLSIGSGAFLASTTAGV